MVPFVKACHDVMLIVLFAVFLLFPVISISPAYAMASGGAITEAEAVRLFIERSPAARAIPLIEQSAAAERRADARPPDPAVAYAVEDAAGVRDEFLSVEQQLPITGRRGLVRESADAAASAAGLAARRDLLTGAVRVRSTFYEVLYRERALAVLREGGKRLERVTTMLAGREREGESSGYDLLRTEQEFSETETAILGAEAELSAARARFASFFDPALGMGSAALEGTFDASRALPELDAGVEQALSRRGDLAALHAERRQMELERRAARRLRFPEPTLSAGWKRTESLGLDDTGYVASVSVPLPLFGRGRDLAARAEADRKRTELEAETLTREIRGDVEAALARERMARQAARSLDERIARRSAELLRIAKLAYDEGESGILELLDAYRTSLSAELRALSVRLEAKRTEIETDLALGIGIGVTP